MTDIRTRLAEEFDDELLLLDPPEHFDRCIIGVAERCGMEPVVVYDREHCIDSMMLGGLDREEAEEFFEFNTAGAYLGPRTPMFLTRVSE